MTKKSKIKFLNISLFLIVILSGIVAVCLRDRLPSAYIPSESRRPDSLASAPSDVLTPTTLAQADSVAATENTQLPTPMASASPSRRSDIASSFSFKDSDIEKMQPSSHPFSREAKKIIAGGLSLDDSISRRKILNYCEHFRSAYSTKDIDFIRQVLSDDALIIVGHTVKSSKNNAPSGSEAVRFSVRSKHEYVRRLAEVFAANKNISVSFRDFKILRHPTMEGIYGVTLRQNYKSDLYSDDGFLFLLWDFRNPSMPVIHVRTWQPAAGISDDDEIIGFEDFNLE